MNTFMNNLTNATNYNYTTNGALAHKSTNSMVYDLFAMGGAFRNRSESDVVLLFKNAFEENKELALKCLFYLRDCRGGQGERRFFRLCFKWLCDKYPEIARRNLENVSEYGRWDDLIYSTIGTGLERAALVLVAKQLTLDMGCKTPSLLAKWMPSENASSKETKRVANIVRSQLGMSHKEYRKTLSVLRTRINIVEKLMSQNRWDEIEFDKIPSKAGLVYKNAFARRDLIAKKYEAFMKDTTTKVNAGTLYPYEIIRDCVKATGWYDFALIEDTERLALEKYWNNLPDYLNGNPCKMMCVVDTSGSMIGNPMNVAISLGIYCAERLGGDFKNHFISFSSRPQLIKVEGVDIVDKAQRIYKKNLCENTNIEKTFDLLLNMALKSNPEDVPETIVVISDMQIDSMTSPRISVNNIATEMEEIRLRWVAKGLTMPKLVYWNVNASKATILDKGPNVSFVSGCSPVIFEQVIKGVTGYQLMLDKLLSERYNAVVVEG